MIDYPAGYPLPDYGNYSGVLSVGLLRTNVPAQQSNQIKRFNAPTTSLSLSFTMDNDDYIAWRIWIDANGFNWFSIPMVTKEQPTDITSTVPIRFTSELNYQKLGDNWLSVTVAAEIQQAFV